VKRRTRKPVTIMDVVRMEDEHYAEQKRLAVAALPDPSSLNYAKLKKERELRLSRARRAVESAKMWGKNPRERLRIALERAAHDKLLEGGLDPQLYDRLKRATRLARARRDSVLPEFRYEAKARTRRRRRAVLELELW
jgi:hypothetical protein